MKAVPPDFSSHKKTKGSSWLGLSCHGQQQMAPRHLTARPEPMGSHPKATQKRCHMVHLGCPPVQKMVQYSSMFFMHFPKKKDRNPRCLCHKLNPPTLQRSNCGCSSLSDCAFPPLRHCKSVVPLSCQRWYVQKSSKHPGSPSTPSEVSQHCSFHASEESV